MSAHVKICHISTVHPRYDVRIFHKEAASLAQWYEVVLLVADGLPKETKRGVKIMALPSVKNRLQRFYTSLVKIIRLARAQRAEIYHLHDPELLPLGIILKWSGARVIYDVHEDLPRDVMRKRWLPRWIRRPLAFIIERIEIFCARRFDGIIAATQTIADRFKAYNENSLAIHNYPLLKEFPTAVAVNTRNKKFCYVGIVLSDRGIQTLLDCIVDTDYTLVLAGNIPEQGLEQQLRTHPGWQRVDFRGWQDRQGVRNIMKECFAGVVTLDPTQAYRESLPVKLFEYMAAGLPVVASNFTLWEKLLGAKNCCLFVNPNDKKDIFAALDRLHQNPSDAIRLGANGRAAIEHQFNWSHEAKNLQAIYARLLLAER